MKLLFATDSHFRATNPPAWRIDYLARLEAIFERLIELTERIRPDEFVFGGDLFDNATVASGRILNSATNHLGRIADITNKTTWINPGQHDGSLRQDWRDCVISAIAAKTYTTWETVALSGGIQLIPHGKMAEFLAWWTEQTKNIPNPVYPLPIWAIHEDIRPAGNNDLDIGGVLLSQLPQPKFVLVGHLHNPDLTWKHRGIVFCQPGSLGRITRADALQAVYAAEIDTESLKVTYHKLVDGLSPDDLLTPAESLIAEEIALQRGEAIDTFANLQEVSGDSPLQVFEQMLFELLMVGNELAQNQRAVNIVRKALGGE